MADATRVPVDVVAVPEGAALGAAFLARVTAGLEDSAAAARRWARVGHRVEPDDEGMERTDARYRRFRELTGPPGPPGGV
jgi:xylulokinase